MQFAPSVVSTLMAHQVLVLRLVSSLTPTQFAEHFPNLGLGPLHFRVLSQLKPAEIRHGQQVVIVLDAPIDAYAHVIEETLIKVATLTPVVGNTANCTTRLILLRKGPRPDDTAINGVMARASIAHGLWSTAVDLVSLVPESAHHAAI